MDNSENIEKRELLKEKLKNSKIFSTENKLETTKRVYEICEKSRTNLQEIEKTVNK